jgi:tRNA U34 5-methylaminomethyl-2-thiouridine-forming methyltransferase MnmC
MYLGEDMEKKEIFMPQVTADGSFTFFSPEFQEAFHSHFGAKQEAEGKFVKPCLLAEKARTRSSFFLLDICYGLGYNTAAALDCIWQVAPNCRVELIALESNPDVPKQAIEHNLLQLWSSPLPELLGQLLAEKNLENDRLKASLIFGDARKTIQQAIAAGFTADAIFLDPFSPPKCPQLWTVDFLRSVKQVLKPEGRIATYSCAASVRAALLEIGLHIGASASIGRKSPGTIAAVADRHLPPLSQQELEHLQTRAAIPYRDPHLKDSAAIIEARRQQEQTESSLELSSTWKKRWLKLIEDGDRLL